MKPTVVLAQAGKYWIFDILERGSQLQINAWIQDIY